MTVDVVADFGTLLAKIKSRYDARKGSGLVCKQGFYTHCFVLKLQKAAWTNDSMDEVRNRSGVFFSMWIDQRSAHQRRIDYNIHALKLRDLRGYAIASRDFAAEFRKRFASMRKSWPNVSTGYGPQTLMQGWIRISPGQEESEIFGLMERFTAIAPVIDQLLDARRIR